MTRLIALLFALTAAQALADTPANILAGYVAEAGAPASVERGRAFFQASHQGGKPETPSCTTCHTTDPRAGGQTRAAKPIEPMAISANPKRFTDPVEVEKWFGRNCDSVLGRPCTAGEKADVIAYLASI